MPAGAQPQRADLAWAATALHAWYTALESILDKVRPDMVRVIQSCGAPAEELVHQGVRANVRHTCEVLLEESALLRRAVAEGGVRVVGAVYDLASGRVEFLDDE